jgi:hypothetical protein
LAWRNLDQLIERAARHVESGRRIVERQRNLIESGPTLPGALDLLASFERSQAIFEEDLARLLKERDKK